MITSNAVSIMIINGVVYVVATYASHRPAARRIASIVCASTARRSVDDVDRVAPAASRCSCSSACLCADNITAVPRLGHARRYESCRDVMNVDSNMSASVRVCVLVRSRAWRPLSTFSASRPFERALLHPHMWGNRKTITIRP